MGGLFSKPEPAPTQKKEINVNEMMAQPWRNVTWTTEERNKLMSEIAAYHPRLNTVPQFRVLFVGPIQAGKSSFFNSVKSVFRGHVTSQAIAGTDLKSVTTQYKTYQVKNEKDGSTLPIIFCDTMGLEEKQGLDIDDVPIIIKGHIPENYQFNPAGAIQSTSPGYIKDPSFKDQIHCFVFIIEAPKIEILPDNMLEKLKTIRRNTNKLGLPQLVILTKVDEVCPSLGKNVSDVYRSKEVEKKMQITEAKLGIPLCNIVPVKNYCSEVELKENVDILILLALRQILRLGENYLDNFQSDEIATVD